MKFNMSCGVVPSRHIVFVLSCRGLRPRLPSLRSVVPSRHLVQMTLCAKRGKAITFVVIYKICEEFLFGYACLEGTTERSDGNHGRSPRISDARTMCL